jgi:hypothetical protein
MKALARGPGHAPSATAYQLGSRSGVAVIR